MIFVDTSGLLCSAFEQEPSHAKAVHWFQPNRRLLTHSYILAEFVALGLARKLPLKDVLQFLDGLENYPFLRVIWISRSMHEQALELLHHRLDKEYSLCDAVSFLIMRQRKIQKALTTDRHFHQEGFVRLLTP